MEWGRDGLGYSNPKTPVYVVTDKALIQTCRTGIKAFGVRCEQTLTGKLQDKKGRKRQERKHRERVKRHGGRRRCGSGVGEAGFGGSGGGTEPVYFGLKASMPRPSPSMNKRRVQKRKRKDKKSRAEREMGAEWKEWLNGVTGCKGGVKKKRGCAHSCARAGQLQISAAVGHFQDKTHLLGLFH